MVTSSWPTCISIILKVPMKSKPSSKSWSFNNFQLQPSAPQRQCWFCRLLQLQAWLRLWKKKTTRLGWRRYHKLQATKGNLDQPTHLQGFQAISSVLLIWQQMNYTQGMSAEQSRHKRMKTLLHSVSFLSDGRSYCRSVVKIFTRSVKKLTTHN